MKLSSRRFLLNILNSLDSTANYESSFPELSFLDVEELVAGLADLSGPSGFNASSLLSYGIHLQWDFLDPYLARSSKFSNHKYHSKSLVMCEKRRADSVLRQLTP